MFASVMTHTAHLFMSVGALAQLSVYEKWKYIKKFHWFHLRTKRQIKRDIQRLRNLNNEIYDRTSTWN